jgi:hypothetical protein
LSGTTRRNNSIRPNCEGCTERCRHSLNSPFNYECHLGDGVAGTGQKEQLDIRGKMESLTQKLQDVQDGGEIQDTSHPPIADDIC